MRKLVLGLALTGLLALPACRSINAFLWNIGAWISGNVFNVYTGNGKYDGRMRWNNFTRNMQKVGNVIDIHFFNYDIRDPYLGAPFFGDPD